MIRIWPLDNFRESIKLCKGMDAFSGIMDVLCKERSRPFPANTLSFTIVSSEPSFIVSADLGKTTLFSLVADIKVFMIPAGTNSWTEGNS